MNLSLSVYLDAIRIAAAMVVFVGHVSGQRLTGGLFWQFGAYMSIAVTIFFVLSGYVIAHVVTRGEDDALKYGVNRAAPIASVCLPAIVLTIVLDGAGRLLSPAMYTMNWGYRPENTWLQIVTALTFTQRLWHLDIPIGSDLPYWSLNYEVWYYALFAAIMFGGGHWRRVGLAAGLAAICGPEILALFPLWLAGVLAYRWRPRLRRRGGWALLAATLLAFLAYGLYDRASHHALAALGPAWRPEIAQDYLISALFVGHLIAFRVISDDLTGLFRRVAPVVRWLASHTFSLYLFHLPIAQFLAAATPLPPQHPLTRGIVFLGTLVLVGLLAPVTEWRKEFWRRQCRGLFAALAGATAWFAAGQFRRARN